MAEIKNFSRHDFNTDQKAVLKKAFPGLEVGEPEASFFSGPEDLAAKVSSQVASLVAPWDMILEALSKGLIAPDTTLIAWQADQAARKRGAFAARGMKAFRFSFFSPDGSAFLEIAVEIVTSTVIEPTMEVDFRSGEERPYGGTAGRGIQNLPG